MSEQTDECAEVSRWRAFAERVTLTFPFRIDVQVSACEREGRGDQAQMGVNLHVLDRDTREPITVLSRRPCAPWTNDGDALDMLFDLLEVGLRHETHESVRLDGDLVRELHVGVTP